MPTLCKTRIKQNLKKKTCHLPNKVSSVKWTNVAFLLSCCRLSSLHVLLSVSHKWSSDAPQTLTVKLQCAQRWQDWKQSSFALPLLHKLYLALFLAPVQHSPPCQESLCVLWPLMRFTSSVIVHTYGMAWTHASCVGVFIFMHLCVHACVCVCVSINVMSTAYPFRLWVKVKVLSWWKLSLPLIFWVKLAHIHARSSRSITSGLGPASLNTSDIVLTVEAPGC